MKNKVKNSNNGGNWIGVGTAIGAAVFAATNEPVWIALGVAIGAALGWRKPKNKNEKEASWLNFINQKANTLIHSFNVEQLGDEFN